MAEIVGIGRVERRVKVERREVRKDFVLSIPIHQQLSSMHDIL